MTTRMVPTRRAMVDVGHQCNIRCLHCYHRFEEGGAFRKKEDIMKDILKAKNEGNTYIDFSGGEPTLHSDIIALVEYVNSLDMKCCIITNGLYEEGSAAGKPFEELIHLVDDWLISTHGVEADHNKITGFEYARAQQECFIELLELYKKTYRFNCCLLSHNQYNIVEFAQWAAEKPGLRIVNFINFNPHGVWNNHPEAVSQMCGMDIIEEQLNKAAVILEKAEKGMNVRYFPMCRIAEENRKYVCNDLQVMHDPYEWAYGVTPKTNETYTLFAQNMSKDNELKSAPCFTCNIRMVCGGINKAFFQMAGNKDVVKPILDGGRERDPFFYRRHNDAVLNDRNPLNDFCVAVIADENMRWYVPMFILSTAKNCPDMKIMVFARYTGHDRLRELVDSVLGPGYYDSVVVDVTADLASYPEHPIATATLRFLEFERELSMFKYVLWTDVDMLLYESDILSQHKKWLGKAWEGAPEALSVYENGAKVPDGTTYRLSGVHFVVKSWWETTAEQRLIEAEKLQKMSTFPRYYDENVLYNIVRNSGMPVMQECTVTPQQRHHGIHLGDWRYGNKNDRVSFVTAEIESQIRKLMRDSDFERVLHECAVQVPALKKIEDIWQSTYCRDDKSLVPALEKQIEADLAGRKPGKVKLVRRVKNGSLAIVAMCDARYAWFAPLFIRSAEFLKEKNPDLSVTVFIRNSKDGAGEEAYSKVRNYIGRNKEETDSCLKLINDDAPDGGYFTAAMRFISGYDVANEADYTLITDIDIMLMPEEWSIISDHMMHMDRDGTECYENWISDERGNRAPRLPGVHFVTKDWWKRTQAARELAYEQLCKQKEIEYCYDEYMLGRIVINSGLPLPPKSVKFWRKHGPHIGDLRIDANRKRMYEPSVWEDMHIRRLMSDAHFLSSWAEAEKHIDYLPRIKKMWMKLINR